MCAAYSEEGSPLLERSVGGAEVGGGLTVGMSQVLHRDTDIMASRRKNTREKRANHGEIDKAY